MTRDDTIYLEHILDSIANISEFTKGFSLDDFLNNKIIQDATIRNLEIIGEATKNIPDGYRLNHPEIEWKKMAGMRDKLIHQYMGVDLWAVWEVVSKYLPELALKIKDLLNQ